MFLDYLYSPYGTKDDQQLYKRLKTGINFLKSKGCSKIIIACNTLSIVAIKQSIKEVITPVFYFKEEIEKSFNDKSILLATNYTIDSNIYNVNSIRFSKLVDIIEGRASININKLILKVNMYDTLYFGCTHFNLLKRKFKGFNIVDSGVVLANNIKVSKNQKNKVDIYLTYINKNIYNHLLKYIHFSNLNIKLVK